MLTAFKNTLRRLSGKIFFFDPVTWYPLLLEGLSVEFERVRVFKDQVMSATVPNPNMTPDAIDDANIKYGIPSYLGGTDSEKINRIIEKANLNGHTGAEWLQDQIQMAGYPLYVIENDPMMQNTVQYATVQYSVSAQYGLTSRFTDPDDIDGDLVVGSPPFGAGRIFLNRYGMRQYGATVLYGTLDPNALNPQPYIYVRTDNPIYWGYYFTLSPFPDRVAVDSSEFLSITHDEYNYLVLLIKQLKMQRNWCILQAKIA